MLGVSDTRLFLLEVETIELFEKVFVQVTVSVHVAVTIADIEPEPEPTTVP